MTIETTWHSARCGQCNAHRCDILCQQVGGEHNDDGFSWSVEWKILQCRGCGYMFAESTEWNSETYITRTDDQGNEEECPYYNVRHWPPLPRRKSPTIVADLIFVSETYRLAIILDEVYQAFNASMRTLCAAGIRAAFDVAAGVLGIGNDLPFARKLDALEAAHYVDAEGKILLSTLVDGGSASIHRGWQPTEKDLEILLALLEHFIGQAFIEPDRKKKMQYQARDVQSRIPPRARKPENS